MRLVMAIAAVLWSGVALAADETPRIVVTGVATVDTTPDLATIDFKVTGEGATSDAAVAAMVAIRGRIASETAGLDPRTSAVSVTAVRGPECKGDDDDDRRALRLSTGKCAIVGYMAAMDMSLRTASVKDAGTLVGLLGRLGAQNPRFDGFSLSDRGAAQRRAMAAALLDARRQAEAIAAGTGVKLGRVLVATTGLRDGGGEDVIVTGSLFRSRSAETPIAVDLTPQPITTRAQVTVTYAIAP